MRRLGLLAALLLLIIGVSGCDLLKPIKAAVTIDIPLSDVTLSSDLGGDIQFVKAEVDASGSADWATYSGNISSFESLWVTGDLEQTGTVSGTIHFYVSPTELPNEAAVEASATAVCDLTIPAVSSQSLETSHVTISAALQAIIADGDFWVYAIGNVSPTAVLSGTLTDNVLHVKVIPKA